jgi:hypothetical protein
MLPLLAALVAAGPTFAQPIPWAINFAPAGSVPIVGDVNGDGYADLIRVSLAGDSFIDVAINAQGMKSLVPQRANSKWGRDCQAACAGDFDEVPGTDVVGLFGGDALRLAHAFKDGSFQDEPDWAKLPEKLDNPHVAYLRTRGAVIAWSEKSGKAFLVTKEKLVVPRWVPSNVEWLAADFGLDRGVEAGALGSEAFSLVCERSDHQVIEAIEKQAVARPGTPIDMHKRPPEPRWAITDLGRLSPAITLSGDLDVTPLLAQDMPSGFPACPEVWSAGDMDSDGDQDLMQFRFGKEAHTAFNVLMHRRISPGETDSDHDGVTNDEEAKLGTDPTNPDTDGDGLLDGWEVNGFRGLDMKALGCDPKRKDIICLISRFSTASKDMVEATFKNIEGYYDSLGWALHPIFIDEMTEAEQKRPWWEGRDKFLPTKWRGVAHWMQITPFGGGQADQLGDGGGCGGNNWTLYATFIHEFGHQLGLSHEGFYPAAWCPTYPSMMNYAYSYTLEGNIKNIRYSDGALKDFVLRETDLDETLPLPYEKVKFLEKAPYHYRLKANGDRTLIDWNWNGIFGEKHIRADINYSYSTTAGRRDEVGKTQCSPWTFTHNRDAYVLYGQQGVKPDGKSDPSVLPDKPGWLYMRRLVKPRVWDEPARIVDEGVTGDPQAISYKGEIVVAYPSTKGVGVRWIKVNGERITQNEATLVDDTNSVPSLGIYKDRLFLIEWDPNQGIVRYRSLTGGHKFSNQAVILTSGAYATTMTSKQAVSMCVDTFKDEVIFGTNEEQSKDQPNRWAIRRYKVRNGLLLPSTLTPNIANSEREWLQGEKSGPRGNSRCVVLFDEKGVTGMKGRVLYFALASTSEKSPWACEYVAQSIGDKTVNSGWMTKRIYDEWTQSRSGSGATWFNGDILYAYRWADGSQGDRDNILHVGYNGTGIEDVPMGDFDDIGYIRDFGMRHSILYLRQ